MLLPFYSRNSPANTEDSTVQRGQYNEPPCTQPSTLKDDRLRAGFLWYLPHPAPVILKHIPDAIWVSSVNSKCAFEDHFLELHLCLQCPSFENPQRLCVRLQSVNENPGEWGELIDLIFCFTESLARKPLLFRELAEEGW